MRAHDAINGKVTSANGNEWDPFAEDERPTVSIMSDKVSHTRVEVVQRSV